MITRLSSKEVDGVIDAMVARASAVAGCRLEEFHTRYSVQAERDVKAAVTPFVAEIFTFLAAENDLVQATPNLRVHRPGFNTSVPFHSDTLYGHSHFEINYWLTLTKAESTNSLWMVSDEHTAQLHERLKQGMSLDEFNTLSQSLATPIETAGPGLYTFCCSQIHGSVRNTTNATRMSLDFRKLPYGAEPGVKRHGYFRPMWLPAFRCPLERGTCATTVASLDLPVPVFFQRSQMQKFFAQEGNRELVEFYGMNHAPTLEDAMQRGPVVAYSIKQVKRPFKLEHPIGFADENVWFSKENQWAFDKYLAAVL